MQALLIFNPAAGQGRPHETLPAIQAALRSHIADVFVTAGPGDAERAAREASASGQFDAVLVAGGDGTLNEAINGLQAGEGRLPLGIVPMGTQNVLAHELGYAVGDLSALASMMEGGRTRAIDLGRADGRYFSLMAGFGFDAAVVQEVARSVKELIGSAAYAFASLGALAKIRSAAMTLTLDGEEIHSEAFMLVVANASSYAFRQVKLAPFATIDDGWLDICVFEKPPLDKVGFVTQMMAALARRHLRDPRVRYYRARHITIASSPPVFAQLDGDMFRQTPLTIEVAPKALTVFVP